MAKSANKKYEGSSYGSAVAAMISDLGHEGKILDVHYSGGFLGIFPSTVTLTVAPMQKKEKEFAAPVVRKERGVRLDTTKESGQDFLEALTEKMGKDLKRVKENPNADSGFKHTQKEVKDILEEMMGPTRSQLSKSMNTPDAAFKLGKTGKSVAMDRFQSNEDLASLRHEIKCLKDEFSALKTEVKVRVSTKSKQDLKSRKQGVESPFLLSSAGKKLSGPYRTLYRLLEEQDFSRDVTEAHLENLMEHFEGKQDVEIEELKSYVQRAFSKTLKIEKPIATQLKDMGEDPPKTGPKIMVLVGPTGVGKTTTMAKIASSLVYSKNPKTVAMITVDSFKMGAPEQVREYAIGLKCPYEAVFSPEKLLPTIKKFQDKDVILIDTTGRGFKDDKQISSLKDVIPDELETQTHLVLSATSRYCDLKKTISSFSRLRVDALLFTKLDETSCYGPMLSILQMSLRKIAYITNGQNVPGDYKAVTPNYLANLIFKKNE